MIIQVVKCSLTNHHLDDYSYEAIRYDGTTKAHKHIKHMLRGMPDACAIDGDIDGDKHIAIGTKFNCALLKYGQWLITTQRFFRVYNHAEMVQYYSEIVEIDGELCCCQIPDWPQLAGYRDNYDY